MKKIFEPVKIGSIEAKNRLTMTAMGSSFSENGYCTEQFIEYMTARAKGGWGIIVTELCRVTDESLNPIMGLYEDGQIASYQKMTEAVHAYGTKIFVQLMHSGRREFRSGRKDESLPIAPSPIAIMPNAEAPREMTHEDIEIVIDQFTQAAIRAKKAGFDGVELHGGHGFLLNAFMSPLANKRLDEYGGSITNRTRIVVEIIKSIKVACGEDYPVTIKISTKDYVDGGLEIEENKAIAMILEEAGIDGITCSQGTAFANSNCASNPTYQVPAANFIENAKAIKSVVNIPVTAVGRLNDPEVAKMVLASTDIDIIGMGKAALADPEYPNKLKANRVDEINRCIGCLQGCLHEKGKTGELHCMVNPFLGRELEYKNLPPVARQKKVYIAGGGVSGCAAAIAAAMRGHRVTVFEQDDVLGGQWRAAMMALGKTAFSQYLIYQQKQMQLLGVEIKLSTPLTAQIVANDKPDTVLVACGGKQIISDFAGMEKVKVISAVDVLLGKAAYGKNVIVWGGGLTGLEAADHMAFYGSKVTLLKGRNLPLATEVHPNVRYYLLEGLKSRNVNVYTGTKLIEVVEDGVIIDHNGEQVKLNAIDTIVMARGVQAEQSLYDQLKDGEAEVILIGDAAKVKDGYQNIYEGFSAGIKL